MAQRLSDQKRHDSGPQRVLIVDDHPIVRHGLTELLNQERDLEVCGSVGTAREALRFLDREIPDIIIADISLEEGRNGLDMIKLVHRRFASLPVLVLTMHDENLYAERVLRAGARGFIMKQEASDRIVEAVRTVLDGEFFVSPRIASRIVQDIFAPDDQVSRQYGLDKLSDRELDVFERLGRGLSGTEIANQLGLSQKTVDTYRANIKRKLGLKNSGELLQHAIAWAENDGAL
ncbi:MAG: response regulator transcription factor [Lentisphaerae bacterium]|nr:response regulator transcription factor [Lentisphaerota bacterium]